MVVVYMDAVLFLLFIQGSIQYSWLFLNKTFLLLYITSAFSHVCFVVRVYYSLQ